MRIRRRPVLERPSARASWPPARAVPCVARVHDAAARRPRAHTTTRGYEMPATAGRETAGGWARTPSARAHPLTLLIVDDDVLLARLLKANVERPGLIEAEV